jgi:uncharacterized membrane protein
MRSYILMFITAILFQGCSAPDKKVTIADSAAVLSIDTAAADTTPIIYKGLYTFGNEVSTFQDCNDRQKVYWVNDSLSSLRKPYENANKTPSYPYESVYAEVKGYLTGKSKMGYAGDYENVLVITDVIKVETKNFRTDCYNYEFIGLGNEPFWSLDIIPEEQRIVLKEAGRESALEFSYTPANIGGGVYRYEATNPAKDKLVVVIREEKCSDGMSDRQYNYSAEITVNGRVLKGCAIKKGDKFPE